MTEKLFTLRISFGDGHPIEVVVPAKTGFEAQDQVRNKYPIARNIHLLAKHQKECRVATAAPEQYVLSLDDADDPKVTHEEKVRTCVVMRKSGHSHKAIAGYLGISKTTVGRWLKQHG